MPVYICLRNLGLNFCCLEIWVTGIGVIPFDDFRFLKKLRIDSDFITVSDNLVLSSRKRMLLDKKCYTVRYTKPFRE